jgi:hypothetical protein
LIHYLKEEDILFKYQFGFRENHSTLIALTLTDTIIDAFEKGDIVLGVFLDFSKAFDTVDHDILLQKLNFYGIRGVANDWVKNYLADRQQYVNYGGNVSPMYNIECGVPQRSILGPLLFFYVYK